MTKETAKKKSRKKATKKVDANMGAEPVAVDPAEELDTRPKLTELELTRLELYEARRNLQSAVLDKLKFKMDLLGIRYMEEKAVIQGRMKSTDNSRDEFTQAYNAQIAAIEKRLGINMKKCLVADDGTVTFDEDIG